VYTTLPACSVLLAVFAFAQVRSVDLDREPWSDVMAALQRDGDGAARVRLEAIGANDRSLSAWERAHAMRWAGEIASRHAQLASARRDFEQARTLDPNGFEGRMSSVHLGEVAIREHRWFDAQRELTPVEHDPDVIISTYAQDRLRTVRERTRRLTLHYGSIALLAISSLALAVLSIAARRRGGVTRSFGRALLVTEALAIVVAMLVPRWNPLAQSGWTAAALPGAVLAAWVWAALLRAPRWRVRAIALCALAVALASGVYVALDVTWWSVERPLSV
jgi:hypothetical protein